jgi:signal transduction histidine kinase
MRRPSSPFSSPSETTRPGQRQVSRASAFFAEAITPIEETHRGALESSAKLNQLISALESAEARVGQPPMSSSAAEILHRQSVEESLRASERTSSQLLAQSREMQEELRHLSRQILSVQEAERRKISRELHDVIAQTLTSINLRLATLKADASASTKDLHLKITRTQRLVEKSVEIIHRFAHVN